MSSTQFEWTIDEVSSLKPVHVEPHETQFQDSPDPDFEAKAQSAISSYFKEQIIVPSPISCPLRDQRIVLSELNATPIAKQNSVSFCAVKHKNVCTQTKLSLPAILPAELEAMLSVYMQQDHSFVCNDELSSSQRQKTLHHSKTEYINKDMSLRRKLFHKHNIILLDGNDNPMDMYQFDSALHNAQACSSPTTGTFLQRRTIAGKLSNSTDKSSICLLSPISTTCSISSPDTEESATNQTHLAQSDKKLHKSKRKHPDFLKMLQDIEDLSPISKPTHQCSSINAKRQKSMIFDDYRSDTNVTSNLSHLSNKSAFDDTSSQLQPETTDNNSNVTRVVQDLMIKQSPDREIDELMDEALLTTPPSNTSNSSDTPRFAKRSTAKRTNLSESLSSEPLDDDDEDNAYAQNLDSSNMSVSNLNNELNIDGINAANTNDDNQNHLKKTEVQNILQDRKKDFHEPNYLLN